MLTSSPTFFSLSVSYRDKQKRPKVSQICDFYTFNATEKCQSVSHFRILFQLLFDLSMYLLIHGRQEGSAIAGSREVPACTREAAKKVRKYARALSAPAEFHKSVTSAPLTRLSSSLITVPYTTGSETYG